MLLLINLLEVRVELVLPNLGPLGSIYRESTARQTRARLEPEVPLIESRPPARRELVWNPKFHKYRPPDESSSGTRSSTSTRSTRSSTVTRSTRSSRTGLPKAGQHRSIQVYGLSAQSGQPIGWPDRPGGLTRTRPNSFIFFHTPYRYFGYFSFMKYRIKFYVACFLALAFGLFGYRAGLDRLKKWVS